ncbi:MAG: arsenate reductase ArsC [Pseudomonadota bacterium]
MDRCYNVLFLCNGNSARSIMAESLLNHWGKDRFQAYSAGSQPKGEVHPLTLELLGEMDFPLEGLRSKSLDEFTQAGAPEMDFVFTVCDQARDETCAVWPGHPLTAHWDVPDPLAAGSEDAVRAVYDEALRILDNRIRLLASLPIEQLDQLKIEQEIERIAQAMPAPMPA